MKHLPKHLRPRWRYLAVEIESPPDRRIGRRPLQRAVWYAAQNLLGDPGSADADLSIVSATLAAGGGEAILKVRRGEVEAARAALACVGEIEGAPVRLRVRGTSGTIRAAEEKYFSGPPEEFEEITVVFRSAERRAVVRGDRVDVETDSGFTGATRFDVE